MTRSASGARAQQAEHTVRTLIAESRSLFARKGYAAVGLSETVGQAGVTKGALYHHFDSKAGLFRAVLEQVQQEVAERVAAAADAQSDPWAALMAGCRAFLAAGSDPQVRQIMLIDGPAVLGWNEWRAMDEAASARHLTEALAGLIESGTIAPQPVEPLARLLSGAMNEAALWLAESAGPDNLSVTTEALARLLEPLRLADRTA